MIFNDREDAARQLSQRITVEDPENTIVLGLPRGGVPLAKIIAEEHGLPLDVIHAKKIGHPQYPEFAVGAVAEGGEPIWGQRLPVGPEAVETVREEIRRRRKLYDNFLKSKEIRNRDVILVDDGIATGLTMFAAIEAVKKKDARKISIAVPIIPSDTYDKLTQKVNEVFYVEVPEDFRNSVGAYYRDFSQVDDSEIEKLLTEK